MSFLTSPQTDIEPISTAKQIEKGDLLVAMAVYEHADTDDFVNPVPERDFSAHAIRYFTKHPEKLSLVNMRAALEIFIWDSSNKRQHARLDELIKLWYLSSENVKEEFLQLFIDQVIWVRRHKAGEFK